MSKAALVEKIAEQMDCTKKEAENIISAFTNGVEGVLADGGEV